MCVCVQANAEVALLKNSVGWCTFSFPASWPCMLTRLLALATVRLEQELASSRKQKNISDSHNGPFSDAK